MALDGLDEGDMDIDEGATTGELDSATPTLKGETAGIPLESAADEGEGTGAAAGAAAFTAVEVLVVRAVPFVIASGAGAKVRVAAADLG